MSEPFLGQLAMVGFNFAPRNYAQCDGQILPINQYQSLYSLLGTTYGGDGRTTFGLPELRGRVPIHWGSGSGLTPRQLGEKGGAETATVNVNQLAAHSHTPNCQTAKGNAGGPAGHLWAADSSGFMNDFSNQAVNNTMDPNATTNTGGGQSHHNMPPCLVINFVIALEGLFPSR
jgi:microcystin-dependent protein